MPSGLDRWIGSLAPSRSRSASGQLGSEPELGSPEAVPRASGDRSVRNRFHSTKLPVYREPRRLPRTRAHRQEPHLLSGTARREPNAGGGQSGSVPATAVAQPIG